MIALNNLCSRQAALVSVLMILCTYSKAQLQNNGGTVVVSAGGQLISNKGVTNAGGTLNIGGSLRLAGNFLNNGAVSFTPGSTLTLEGSTSVAISGSTINAQNVVVNNPAGVLLNTDLNLYGQLTLSSGNVITAGNSVLAFANGSGLANAPGDASHINGKVRFDGTGSFTYPVGNGTRYQPIAVNLGSNTSGLIAFYQSGDAGTAPFTTAGSDALPLVSYNKNEYWIIELPAGSSGNASGTTTIYWDGYNDAYGNPLSERTTARKVNGGWNNEGGNATGSTSSGSLTSNVLSSWGMFTLGSDGGVLPVKWITVNGRLNNLSQPEFNWIVSEQGTLSYHIEKSSNAAVFFKVGSVEGKADGSNQYLFRENSALAGTWYYRIKQIGSDGRVSYSSTIKLSADKSAFAAISVYPSVVRSTATLSIRVAADKHSQYFIVNSEGKVVETNGLTLYKGLNLLPVDLSRLATGVYTIVLPQAAGNLTTRFIRK